MSNTKLDLPEPLGPVTTVISLVRMSRFKFLSVCCRAPLIRISPSPESVGVDWGNLLDLRDFDIEQRHLGCGQTFYVVLALGRAVRGQAAVACRALPSPSVRTQQRSQQGG